jgi:hypothetical protein
MVVFTSIPGSTSRLAHVCEAKRVAAFMTLESLTCPVSTPYIERSKTFGTCATALAAIEPLDGRPQRGFCGGALREVLWANLAGRRFARCLLLNSTGTLADIGGPRFLLDRLVKLVVCHGLKL